MAEEDRAGEHDLAAGDFSSWITEVQGAIHGEHGSDVPCGGCTACCTSSQFVHIAPDETDTLAHIAPELLFPAPRLPRGHLLLGYDEHGHCPMLIEGGCSIYDHRPRTCRTYDCRVLAAAGLHDEDKPRIDRQVRRWRFTYPSAGDKTKHEAVGASAAFLDQHRDGSTDWPVPTDTTQLAVLAIEVHDLFVGGGDGQFVGGEDESEPTVAPPDPEIVRVEIARRRSIQGQP